ncbi:MAG: patatin-like phospholipase family protein [Alphaproteobacteria bacterium]
MKIARILSIDGGGIRGVMPAVVLAAIERRLGKPISSLFHMVAGTSTGAVLGFGLTKKQPYSGQQMLDLYQQFGPRIFYTNWWRNIRTLNGLMGPYYDYRSWETVLEETLGEDLFSECSVDFLVAAYDMERRIPAIFKSWKTRGERLPAGIDPKSRDFKIRDLARGSSAAPTYFSPARICSLTKEYCTLIDGGVYANNPAALALASAKRLYPNADALQVVSLGTGTLSRPFPFDKARYWGRPQWAMPVIEILGGAVDDTIDYQLETSLRGDLYYRFQTDLLRREPNVPAPSDMMDDDSTENIEKLFRRGNLMLEEQGERFDKLLMALDEPLTERTALL